MEMTFLNLTPHSIQLRGVVYPPSGSVARLEETGSTVTLIGGLPYRSVDGSEITGLPDPEGGSAVFYLVSRPVAMAAQRPDVVAPDLFERDDHGQIIGAGGIVWFPPTI